MRFLRYARSKCLPTQNWSRPVNNSTVDVQPLNRIATQNRSRPYAESVAPDGHRYAELVAGLRRIGRALYIEQNIPEHFLQNTSQIFQNRGVREYFLTKAGEGVPLIAVTPISQTRPESICHRHLTGPPSSSSKNHAGRNVEALDLGSPPPQSFEDRPDTDRKRHCIQLRLSRRTNRTGVALSWRGGYEDLAFFRRLFKRTTDMSPGAYRKRFQIPKFARNPTTRSIGRTEPETAP